MKKCLDISFEDPCALNLVELRPAGQKKYHIYEYSQRKEPYGYKVIPRVGFRPHIYLYLKSGNGKDSYWNDDPTVLCLPKV